MPGSKTERYGGNTSCVEVRSPEGTRIIIDAGTGIRLLGKQWTQGEADDGGGSAHLLISHTHWDHIQGLPFYAPLRRHDHHLHVYARRRDDLDLRAVLASQTEEAYLASGNSGIVGEISFRELGDSARFDIADVNVSCTRLNHPYVATAYRLVSGGCSVAYVSDTAPFSDILFENQYVARPPPAGAVLPESDLTKLRGMRDGVVRLCEGADVVIYDTMFTPDDYLKMPHFGHSRPSDALDICRDAGARRLVLFHHAPERTDGEVDTILEETRANAVATNPALDVFAAYEGLDIDLRPAKGATKTATKAATKAPPWR